MKPPIAQLLEQFEAFEIDATAFGHREHVEVAFAMLQKYDFVEGCARYARTINTIATNAGAAEKFNVTITFAFLSLIAERMHRQPELESCDDFIARNEDLLSSAALGKWYSKEQLQSEFARTHFLLPRQAA